MRFYKNVSVTSHIKYIVTRGSDKRCLSHGMCLYQVIMMLIFNDIVNDAESTQKSIITSRSLFLKSEL